MMRRVCIMSKDERPFCSLRRNETEAMNESNMVSLKTAMFYIEGSRMAK